MSRFRLGIVALLLAVPVIVLAIDPSVAKPPVAKKDPTKLTVHGETRVDDFFWMKDKKNPEVIKYLEAENDYTAALLKPTEKFQEALYKEFLSRIKQTDEDVPVQDRGFWYYTRTVEGKQYPIHCRKKDEPMPKASGESPKKATEEVMLDGNELAKGEKFFRFGEIRVSDDGNLLAYSTDTTGFREYVLFVKDLRTGKPIENKLVKSPQFEWAADGKTLFYATEDEAKRAHKIWRHTLGQPKEKDELVYEEKDELFWLELGKSRDRKYLFHSSVSYTSTEQRFLAADKPAGQWQTILKREADHEYFAEHRNGKFYIRTNKKATNFKIVTCPVEKTDPANWTDLMPYDEKVFIEGVSVFKNHLVLSARVGGLSQLIVRDLGTGATHTVEFKEPVYDVQLSSNPESDTDAIRFTYTSLVTSDSEYEYDMTAKTRKLLKQKKCPAATTPRTTPLSGWRPPPRMERRCRFRSCTRRA